MRKILIGIISVLLWSCSSSDKIQLEGVTYDALRVCTPAGRFPLGERCSE